MNNEPVAWMQIHYKDKMCITKYCPVKTWEDDIPLYTHPSEHDLGIAEAFGFDKGYQAAKAKTLTDEEILELSEQWLDMSWRTGVIDFARAILRKANEK